MVLDTAIRSSRDIAPQGDVFRQAGEQLVLSEARAVMFNGDSSLETGPVSLNPLSDGEALIEVHWSGVSTGTERRLWTGEMPAFPGLTYPLVPGYEAVGRVIQTRGRDDLLGRMVFVPGSKGFKDVACLFGASASRLVVEAEKLTVLDIVDPREGALLALAATAHHAIVEHKPDLIVGHGVLGRLARRICTAIGKTPTVWEINPERRRDGAFEAIDPASDDRRDYGCIVDMSGAADLLDRLVMRLVRGGEIVLAGFYEARLGFNFPMAFMKEARLRIAAEWTAADIETVLGLVSSGALKLDGLITHTTPAARASDAYKTAFTDPACLKMIIDWRAEHG